ncbi:hypothetical protein [Massilia sp. Se16.2.3]|uniref:hypothetical protein n=1 Tax=Massilia sp. Se16.2.3 TaxID=2709303 RepID=UPI0015FF40AA|nr:hypothetical protein [Massilia sp. Se16.2.3]QNB00264.1 hypothetical protein G4G31_17965 [Massilia sp. Se16.2.3]
MLGFLRQLGSSHLITWQPGHVLTLATSPAPLALRHAPLPAPFTLMPSMLRAPGLKAPDYLSMLKTGWRGMRFGEEQVAGLDRISALDFFRSQGVSERMIDWWWRFAAMVVTNVPLERCSSASLLRIHAQLSGYAGLHFGFAAVGLGELAYRAGAQLHRGAWRARAAGHAGTRTVGEGRVDGVLLADGARLRADVVVSALPPMALAPLLTATGSAPRRCRHSTGSSPVPTSAAISGSTATSRPSVLPRTCGRPSA